MVGERPPLAISHRTTDAGSVVAYCQPYCFVSPTMYAIIAADGRQYKVQTGDQIQIDFREDAKEGDAITFDNVLLVSGGEVLKLGKPAVKGASVAAEVIGQEMGDKLYIQKMRR